jgi:para-aminobenzoate synthetase component 1
MREINFSADEIVKSLLGLPKEKGVCLLDSGGISNLGSRYLIAGFDAVEIVEIKESDAEESLKILDEKTTRGDLACILTISYEFGLKINKLKPRSKEFSAFDEPDLFLAFFDFLVVHDYDTKKSFLTGNPARFDEAEKLLIQSFNSTKSNDQKNSTISEAFSNFKPAEYIETVEKIQEFIRRGDTYQTNLTQQLRIKLPENFSPAQAFLSLRQNHPAPFSAFLQRPRNVVISASPERFFKVQSLKSKVQIHSTIETSPIKGTRPRGQTSNEDLRLREELSTSEKDRAENVMIVDLLRNDLGRICEYGSVAVEKLCDLETHPTLFHLVSTIRGNLRDDVKFSEILKAVFPCGSITGAPKISTMRIIDQLETAPRGLSMGAIGFVVSGSQFSFLSSQLHIDLSVAIRTAVIQNNEAIFNVGGGIVIDSVPADEYAETLTKAKALLKTFNAELKF